MNQISTRNLLLALIERKGEPWAALWGRDIASGNVRGAGVKLARLFEAVRDRRAHNSRTRWQHAKRLQATALRSRVFPLPPSKAAS